MKLSKPDQERLHAIRKMLRESTITQRDIREKLGMNQSTASVLINILVKTGEAYVCDRLYSHQGRNPTLVYALADASAVAVNPGQITYTEPQPTFWQRFKCWLSGNPYAGVRA